MGAPEITNWLNVLALLKLSGIIIVAGGFFFLELLRTLEG